MYLPFVAQQRWPRVASFICSFAHGGLHDEFRLRRRKSSCCATYELDWCESG
jgi:hypothetical protein